MLCGNFIKLFAQLGGLLNLISENRNRFRMSFYLALVVPHKVICKRGENLKSLFKSSTILSVFKFFSLVPSGMSKTFDCLILYFQ